MPVILTKPDEAVEGGATDYAACLVDAKGKPTLEARVLRDFLSEVDFEDLFELPEAREFVETITALARLKGEDYEGVTENKDLIEKFKKGENPFKKKAKDDDEDDEDEDDDEDVDEAKKGEDDDEDDEEDDDEDDEEDDDEDDEDEDDDDDMEEVHVERLAGDVIAEFVDTDDLMHMFAHYLGSLPTESLNDKARAIVWEKYLGEGAITEFQKGSFRKIAKTAQGHAAVKAMMLAMLHKQAIRRNKAKPVSTSTDSTKGGVSSGGYKGGGYMKGPGYAPGTKPGVSKVRKYKKKKNAKLKTASKIRQTKVGKVLKAVAKGGGDKKASVARLKVKKNDGKKSLTASQNTPGANLTEKEGGNYVGQNRLMEGPRLSGAIINKLGSLNEAK